MRRLLVVDDEPHTARVLRVTLEREGWTVDTALSGEEALARIEAAPPDALITDISMPGMGGKGLCRALRTTLAEHSFPILVMTSMTASSEREWVRELGGIDFLEKPVSPRRVAAKLARYFRDEVPS